ncbi:MAG: hypothetical protein ACOH2A_14785 [Sphingobacteriaceae bacterium]
MRSILIISLLFFQTVSNAQLLGLGNRWEAGHYYDVNGQKVDGFISRDPAGKSPQPGEGFIIYKAAKDAEKQKLSASMIRSFVIGLDSFTVTHNTHNELRTLNGIDFIKVLVNEPLKLYAANAAVGRAVSPAIGGGFGSGGGIGGGVSINLGRGGASRFVYYYGTNPDMLTEVTHKNYVEILSEIMAGQPEAVEKIRKKTYKFNDLPKLIVYFYQLKTTN